MTVAFSLILIIGIIALIAIVAGIVAIIAVAGKKPESFVESEKESYFDGSVLGLFGWKWLGNFLTTITFGIAFPWATCMVTRWEVKHTVINGRRLKFNGNGAQLFGKYILWAFLTVITCGIYSIWMGLGIEKWKVKHIVYADKKGPDDSRFTGTAGGWFINHLLLGLLTFITFGIAYPWADVRLRKWKAKNTVIGGSALVFNGKGGSLWVKLFVCGLLTPLTLGIYPLFFFPVSLLKWHYKNIDALYRTAPIIALSRSHEDSANKDYAKIRLAANDLELASVKSGFTGIESDEELENLANGGNIFAAYALAKKLKGDEPKYEGHALELLKAASDGKHHQAIFEYSDYAESLDEKITFLEESAKCGNAQAPWILKQLYLEKKENDLDTLTKAAYWFKVAIELEDAEALNSKAEYDELLERIAIIHAGKHKPESSSSVGIIVAAVVGGLVLLIAVFMVFLLFFPKAGFGSRHKAARNEFTETTRIPIFAGDSEFCTVRPKDLNRAPNSSYYQKFDFEETTKYTQKIGSENIDIEFYLGNTVFYDDESKTLFVDFGISENSYINGNKKFMAYLVSDDIKDNNGKCKILGSYLLAGEKIASIPCELPSGLTKTKLHLIIVYVPDGIGYYSYENSWVADFYRKTVNVSYEPIEDDTSGNITENETSKDENSQPDNGNTENNNPEIELSNTPNYDLNIGGVKTDVTDADIQILYDMVKETNIFDSHTNLTEDTDTIRVFNDYVVTDFGRGMFNWFDFECEYIPDPNPNPEFEHTLDHCRYNAEDVDWVLKAVFNRDAIHYAKSPNNRLTGYYQDDYFIRIASERYAGNPISFIKGFEGSYEYLGNNLYRFVINIDAVDSIEHYPFSYTLTIKARPMHSQNYGTYWQILECIGSYN